MLFAGGSAATASSGDGEGELTGSESRPEVGDGEGVTGTEVEDGSGAEVGVGVWAGVDVAVVTGSEYESELSTSAVPWGYAVFFVFEGFISDISMLLYTVISSATNWYDIKAITTSNDKNKAAFFIFPP